MKHISEYILEVVERQLKGPHPTADYQRVKKVNRAAAGVIVLLKTHQQECR